MKAWKLLIIVAAITLALGSSASEARAQVPLGITIEPTPDGIVVTEVVPGGIADRCMPRLRPGARLITVNGDPIKSAEQFKQIVDTSDYVRFEFFDRNGERRWARAWNSRGMPLPCRP
jgi:S1-C subfamily serine protease